MMALKGGGGEEYHDQMRKEDMRKRLRAKMGGSIAKQIILW